MSAPQTPASNEIATLIDTRLTVPGMRCAGCIAKVERGLGELAGVDSARVNFSAKRVAVRHQPNIDADQLADELRQLGFDAQIAADNPLAQDDAESRKLQRALAVAGFGMMNIMLLSVSVWSGASGDTREMFHWLSALIAIPVVAFSGQPFFASAWMALRYRQTNMDVPISIGVLLATGLSFYETLTGGEHAYFDSAVMLLFFLLAGRALDAMMRKKTRSGIGALLGRMGKSASVIDADGTTKRILAQALEPGMVMLVAAGEALAADGEIITGQSALDNSMLTGESAPDIVQIGSVVHAGAINVLAPIEVRITATANDTVIAEIARLMDEAGQSRSKYVRIADRASRLYAPVVHSLSALAFIGWMVAGAGWHQSLVIAIAVLIITCPCAMGLAVPAAQVVTTSALLKRGLLVKDGSALERLAEVDIALFDKTGTLTLGEALPEVSHLDDGAQSIALGLAQSSRHPLSVGLSKKLQSLGVVPAQLSDLVEQAGVGVFAQFKGQEVSLTRPLTHGANLASSLSIGSTAMIIDFSDALRVDAVDAIGSLRLMGIESQILSGDCETAVSAVAKKLEIGAKSDLSPKEKLTTLETLRADNWHPLMVGDGLNDGPALAAAHASIAPGTASDASQQAADAVFIGAQLMPVAYAIRASRRTMKIVRQNFGFAIGYNVLAVPLALAGMVTPLIAAIAMSASSVVVVANSLRLARSAR